MRAVLPRAILVIRPRHALQAIAPLCRAPLSASGEARKIAPKFQERFSDGVQPTRAQRRQRWITQSRSTSGAPPPARLCRPKIRIGRVRAGQRALLLRRGSQPRCAGTSRAPSRNLTTLWLCSPQGCSMNLAHCRIRAAVAPKHRGDGRRLRRRAPRDQAPPRRFRVVHRDRRTSPGRLTGNHDRRRDSQAARW